MKPFQQQWIKLSTKLDALSLRERAMVFVAVTAAVLFLIYTVAVEPMLVRQNALLVQIKQQQNQIGGIDMEIAAKAQAFVADPDAAAHGQLQMTRADIGRISGGLLAVQKGLVAPDRVVPLLEHLLRGNGKLRLVSMKTLPVTGMIEVAGAAATPAAAANATAPAGGVVGTGTTTAATAAVAPKPHELLYRHGVEIVLQGSYLDMVNYMDALEKLPTQLFWGKAQLDAQAYPTSRLTLTLFTLSLDEKWMKL